MVFKFLKNKVDEYKSDIKIDKVRRELKELLDRYEKILSDYEKQPDKFSHEHLADSMSDLVYNSGISSFLATICKPHNLENPDLKLNDICYKWDRVMENRNNKLINEEMFNEFRNGLDMYSSTYEDNKFDGLSIAKFFDEKIWKNHLKSFYERTNELNDRLWNIVYLRDSRIHQLIRQDFNSISPFEFEEVVGDLFVKMGYSVEVTAKTGDYGIDVIARNNFDVIAIQVKKYSKGNNVGNQEVQKLLGAMQLSTVKANKAILITTSDFTINAIEQAKETPIELWNGHYLSELLKKVYEYGLKNVPEHEIERRNQLYKPIINMRFECPKCGANIKEEVNSCRVCKTKLSWKNGKPMMYIDPFFWGCLIGCTIGIFIWIIIIIVVVMAI
jgi:hypothetical protein